MPLFRRRREEKPPPGGGDEAPGWRAIDAALKELYGDATPTHVAPMLPPSLGGPGGLAGCSAYAAEGHWHYVTYGLSALFEPDTGWGIELTLRVRRGDEEEAPRWAFAVLDDLARYVLDTGNVLVPGDWMETPGAITGYPANPAAPPTGLTCVAFAEDPELGRIETPHGEVTFVQVVGITVDELRAMADGDAVLDRLADDDPLLVTDLTRA